MCCKFFCSVGKSCLVLPQDFAQDLRTLFAQADALDMGPLMQPGGNPQAAAADMATDAGVNKLLLQVCTLVLQLHTLCLLLSHERPVVQGITQWLPA